MHHLYKVDAKTGASVWRSSSLGSFTTLRPYPASFIFHDQNVRDYNNCFPCSQRHLNWQPFPTRRLKIVFRLLMLRRFRWSNMLALLLPTRSMQVIAAKYQKSTPQLAKQIGV